MAARPTPILVTDVHSLHEGKTVLGTILLIILILLLIGALPRWGYSTGWGYYPSGEIGARALDHYHLAAPWLRLTLPSPLQCAVSRSNDTGINRDAEIVLRILAVSHNAGISEYQSWRCSAYEGVSARGASGSRRSNASTRCSTATCRRSSRLSGSEC